MKSVVIRSCVVATAIALGAGCSSAENSGPDDMSTTGGAINIGSGGVQAAGSGGVHATGSGGATTMTMTSTGGTSAAPMGSGGMMGPGGNPSTGGSMAPPATDGGSNPMVDGGTTAGGGAGLLPTDDVGAMGPYEVTIDMSAGPNMGWIAHPKELGANGELHPIFTWGCGGGSEPSQYMDHLTRWASHGFVVEAHVSTGDAADHKVIVDWLIAQNDDMSSMYYHKLDVTKIAVGGHSMGSIATFAFEGGDDRVTTSIHVAGGSYDGNGFMSLKTPTLMVDGDGDTLALSNTQRDYMMSTVPTFITVITGSDHIYAARDGMAPIIAWLRWWLAGEVDRKGSFLDPDCEFCKAPYVSMSKNW
jgi:hypothetical protein